MGAETCRSGRHSGQWKRKRNGRRYCADCAREGQGLRALSSTADGDRWSDPAADRDRVERLAAWRATVDVAIARVRLTEGFDGRYRTWQTLGECLRPEPKLAFPPPAEPVPVRVQGTRQYRASDNGAFISARNQRLQRLAAEDRGRLVS